MTAPDLAPLLGLLAAPDADRRLAAVQRLTDLRDAALPALDALVVALDDPDAAVRYAAVQAIGVLDPVETEEALLWASQSEDRRVRTAANTLIHATARERGPESEVFREPVTWDGE
jgi:HEAT repeat protein